MKIAFVYDRVNKIGGAERILMALHEIWPQAPLYTAVYNPESAPWSADFKVIPSFLQKFPWARTRHEFYAPLMPLAFESFTFDPPAGGFDVVISITSAEAKGIITKPKTLHVCYCLTPTRYLWSGTWDYKIPALLGPLRTKLRSWDQMAASRPDLYLAISQNVARRIKKYYRQDAEVIYPPVDTRKWKLEIGNWKIGDYFLIVSRLVPYKRVDIAIEAFNQLDLPLKIIGTGMEMEKLKKMAHKNIEFLGQLTDEEVLGYYQRCRAVVFPGEEDFGLVPLEAASCGKPTIAYQGGGVLETVLEGKTGEFFAPQTVRALVDKVKSFKPESYQPDICRAQAERFREEVFKEKFKTFIERKWKNYLKNISTS
jgi:glycosyltransferase involved in cell wall biosynthesis